MTTKETPFNPIQETQAPIVSEKVNHAPDAPEESPLKSWVESQKNIQESAFAEQKEEVDAKEQAKLDANKDLVDASQEDLDKDPKLSARFAALSQREKSIVDRERQIKALEDKYKGYEGQFEEYKSSSKKVLDDLGLTFEQFTSMYLDELDGKQPKKSVESMIEEVKKEQAEFKTGWEEQKRQVEEAQKKQIEENYKKDLKNYISGGDNLDKFELINAKKAYDMVYDVIESYYHESLDATGQGEMLTPDQAAEMVEKHFEEEAQTFLQAKKFAKKEEPVKEEPKKSSVTLSNRSAGGAAVASHGAELSKLSKTEESKRKAAALLKWS